MLNVMKWKWTPPAVTVLLIVIGVLRQLDLLGSTSGNAISLLLIAVGVAWAFAGVKKLHRLSELYLWLVFVLSLGLLQDLANRIAAMMGIGNSLTVYVGVTIAHLLVICAALWIVGAWTGDTTDSSSKSYHAGLAAGLLIVGATIVWIGATVWPGERLERVATQLAAHQWANGFFLLGAVTILAGLAIFTVALREFGDRLFSELGLIGFLFGSVFWIINLAFRLTVTVSAADEMARTGTSPASFEMWRMWAGLLFGVYIVMAYLAIAAYGGALLKTRLLARGFGWTCVVLGLAVVTLFVARVPGFDLPLEVPIVPYLIGMLLLRRGSKEANHAPKEGAA